MPSDRMSGLSWPQAAVTIAALAAFAVLAVVDSGVALILGIMFLLFGGNWLFGYDNWDDWEDEDEDDAVDEQNEATQQDALNRLRTKYAEGEFTEAEFERRLETLLQTETVDDIEGFLAGDSPVNDRTKRSEEATDKVFERSNR